MNKIARFAIKYVFGVVSTIYLFTIGWAISGRARGLITTICTHFGFAQDRLRIPPVELSELVSSVCSVRLVELPEHNGNITLQELSVIAAVVKQHAPKTIFEIGTFDGRTTLNMANNGAPEARLFTLDLPRARVDSTKLHVTTGDRIFIDKPESGARFAGTDAAQRITQLFGDSAELDFSPYFGTIDLVFVDGSHAYDYVRNDTEIALKLLRDGRGVILWHDYTAWVGVTKALNELYQQNPALVNMRNIKGTTIVYARL